ncbi:MAG TPA: transcription initiation factor TFIIIB [Nitrosopumilaceae archaeon]|nr:transcription initiation factor TFIIIB [Nitrosopumilaceae archaeon]
MIVKEKISPIRPLKESDSHNKLYINHETSHGPEITDNATGEILCGSCGLVLLERTIDSSQEQHGYNLEEYMTRSRTGGGSTLTIHDMGLSTMIGTKDKDASGNAMSGYMKNTFGRLRIWDSRSKWKQSQKSFASAFVILDSVKAKLNIPDLVAERAAYLYRKAISEKMSRGRTIKALILAALYTACKESEIPKSLQEIARAEDISPKELSRNYRLLSQKLELQLKSFDSTDFVNRIANTAGLSEKTRRKALDILFCAKEKGITEGKNPISLAASALYISSLINGEKRNQKSLARASGISNVTIRNVSKIIRKACLV